MKVEDLHLTEADFLAMLERARKSYQENIWKGTEEERQFLAFLVDLALQSKEKVITTTDLAYGYSEQHANLLQRLVTNVIDYAGANHLNTEALIEEEDIFTRGSTILNIQGDFYLLQCHIGQGSEYSFEWLEPQPYVHYVEYEAFEKNQPPTTPSIKTACQKESQWTPLFDALNQLKTDLQMDTETFKKGLQAYLNE